LESNKAQKLVTKILGDLDHAGIIINTVVEDLKALREFTKKEQNPLATKVLRLAYEYIGQNEGFDIAIPDDDPIEDESGEVISIASGDIDPKESLSYLVSLFKDLTNKNNIIDLKVYRDTLWEELY